MRNRPLTLVAFALALALPCAALAEAGLGDYVYGAWSAWTTRQIQPSETIDVQTRKARQLVLKDTYSYSRYVYFNTQAARWYATCTENPPFERTGSGRWEEKAFDAPLAVVGSVNGQPEYDGHWFLEQVQRQIDRDEPITQYRQRSKARIECELDVHDAVLPKGETYQIPYKLASDVTDITFASGDPAVASVSNSGVITALDVGEVDIEIRKDQRRIEGLRLTVGERVQVLDSGIYSIQLANTKRFLAPKNTNAKPDVQLIASQNTAPEKRYFHIEQQSQDAFRLKLANAQILYVGAQPKASDKTLRLRGQGDSGQQLFSFLRLSSGDYLMYPAGHDGLFVGLNAAGSAMLKTYDALDESLLWRPEKEPDDAIKSGIWIPPVVRNGVSYVSGNYNPAKQHNGVDFASGGERVSVVSVAAGRVVYAFNGCEHDYGKKKNAKGEYEDACGKDRTFGNVVIVEHDGGLRTTYSHLSRALVKEGDKVSQGQVLGVSGSTGASSATHLHFEVRQGGTPLNPRQYVELPKIEGKIR